MRFTPYVYITAIMLLFATCSPDTGKQKEEILTEVNISLDSANFQRVYDLIDHWQQDSLLPYLTHKDPSFRVLATYGFAAMMDDKYIKYVGAGVLDPVPEVRRATAYVLGQSYNPEAVSYLMKIFDYQDSLGIDPLTFKYGLEAIGKCGDSNYLSLMSGITTYQVQDTLLLEGQCLGMLQMAQRGFSDTAATALMLRYVTDTQYSGSVRLIAANYLVASDEEDLSDWSDELATAYKDEQNPEIRMFIARVMGRTGRKAGAWIQRAFITEKDPGVRIELLRGSVVLPLYVAHGIWNRGLTDDNIQVARTAGDLIVENGSSGYSKLYTNWAFSNFKPVVYARILAAGNKYITNSRFRQMVQALIFQRIRSTSDPYLKSDFIMAASQRLETARQLISYDRPDAPAEVRTSILNALVLAVDHAGNIGSTEKNFLIERWNSGDVAALSILSPFFVNHKSWFPELTTKSELWAAQSEKIKMPGGVEARIQVDKARESLFGYNYDLLFYRQESLHTHDIDWDIYKQLSERPVAEIVTNRGTMKISLFKQQAPATVINFVQLAESGYYDGKLIHRVVPNFVIQGGGNRGDGYGSTDYTIRSELGPLYYDQSGYVGMASAGKHTESQQWFITLRPTLHLDGKYTQFARLTEGDKVLKSITRGDQIEHIQILK